MQRISGDFETASTVSLPEVGAHVYASHPSTRVLCLGWALNDRAPRIWYPGREPFPGELRQALEDGAEFHAWNAAFEQAIWYAFEEQYDLPQVRREQWHCTMARAAFWGLPLKLEQAAQAARLNIGKDMEGHKLMLRMCRPRVTLPDGSVRWWDIEEPERLLRLGQYCGQDVETERAVGRSIPAMPNFERRLWLLDQRMNNRGMRLDTGATFALSRVMRSESQRLSALLQEATDGAVTQTTQAARVRAYLNNLGLDLDNMRKDYLSAILARTDLTDKERYILLLYRAGAKASTAKLAAMRRYCCDDGRIRALVQYGGAMRTMRWAGRGPQIQNYPRPIKGLNTIEATVDIMNGMTGTELQAKYGHTPLVIVSAALRGCFIPARGKRFAVCDYSAIEARVVAWLAGQIDLLDVFRRGEDVYMYTASKIGSTDRLLGKILTLACGYGMGPERFMATALGYGVVLTLQQATEFVYGWREANAEIKNLWYAYDQAFRDILLSGSETPIHVGAVSFRMAKSTSKLAGCLLMRLPSGRNIVYRQPRLVKLTHTDETTGEKWSEVIITYMGHNLAKQWVRIKTWGGKIVENATQAIARDLLADAMLRLDALALPLDTTVHDEIIAEPDEDEADDTLAVMQREMRIPPAWAIDLPLNAEGNVLNRYGKG